MISGFETRTVTIAALVFIAAAALVGVLAWVVMRGA